MKHNIVLCYALLLINGAALSSRETKQPILPGWKLPRTSCAFSRHPGYQGNRFESDIRRADKIQGEQGWVSAAYASRRGLAAGVAPLPFLRFAGGQVARPYLFCVTIAGAINLIARMRNDDGGGDPVGRPCIFRALRATGSVAPTRDQVGRVMQPESATPIRQIT